MDDSSDAGAAGRSRRRRRVRADRTRREVEEEEDRLARDLERERRSSPDPLEATLPFVVMSMLILAGGTGGAGSSRNARAVKIQTWTGLSDESVVNSSAWKAPWTRA